MFRLANNMNYTYNVLPSFLIYIASLNLLTYTLLLFHIIYVYLRDIHLAITYINIFWGKHIYIYIEY